MRSFALALVLAALTGCGTSGPGGSKSPGEIGELQDARQLDLWFAEIEAEEAKLGSLLAQPPVDCPRACDLRASIANLARQICSLTARLEPDRERQIQCVDARRRAEQAKASVMKVCECVK